MEVQNGFRIAHLVLVILGIMPSVKGEGAFADVAVNVLNLVLVRYLAQDDHAFFHLVLEVGSSLAQEAVDHVHVALGEHGGHGVVFGRKIEQLEIIRLRPPQPGVVTGVDIGKLVFEGVDFQAEILKGEAAAVIKLAGVLRVAPVAVEVAPLRNFYPAEEYHQKSLDKNPGGYCHIPPAKFKKAAEARVTPAGYPGRDQLAAAGLASLKVLPQELSENGIDLYDGYVQCGLFADPAGLPQLMLVNRRTEYVPPRPGSNKDDADELQFVPNRELDAACLPAPPQSLRMAAAAETLSRLGSYAGWWDSYSGKVYPCGEGGCEVEIGPGDGMLLALVGTLPARVGSAAILSGKAVVAGPTVLASGARVSQDVKSTLLVTGDITVESGASLVLRGEVEVADGVHIYVRPGGLVDLKDARLRWGKKSGLVKL